MTACDILQETNGTPQITAPLAMSLCDILARDNTNDTPYITVTLEMSHCDTF